MAPACRAREESMQFSAALDDHRQFLRRKREAHAMHMEVGRCAIRLGVLRLQLKPHTAVSVHAGR